MPATPAVSTVRAFNRGYTKVIGVLDEGLHHSPYTLTECRVLFEVAHSPGGRARVVALRSDLGLDAGYLSRILSRFEDEGFMVRGRDGQDARRSTVTLTERGRTVFAGFDAASDEEVTALLARLAPGDAGRLVEAMGAIGDILGLAAPAQDPETAVTLRGPRAGDYGWAVERHGVLYKSERDFDETFEACVARIVADYAGSHDPGREAFWIAEVGGRRAGCVMCVERPGHPDTAQLRILLVEPAARGLGVGRRLVEECVAFARRAGYRRMFLSTVEGLSAAHAIYRKAGFEIVRQEAVRQWGHALVEQDWALDWG
jgi:DNA-binding MarR family transcriptional regulator/ribosomal protein S18 acetylase RimI-like enzyme